MHPHLQAVLADHPDVKAVPGSDLYVVARVPLPTEAAMVQGCLMAAGIPSELANANTAQAYFGAVTAFGGVPVMVLARWVTQALEVLAAYERGDFLLDENTDVGAAEHDTPGASSRQK